MPVRALSRVDFQPLDYSSPRKSCARRHEAASTAACRLLAVIRASDFHGSVLVHCTTAQARPAARPTRLAPVAQGIEHRPPEAGAQVRILSGALTFHLVSAYFARCLISTTRPWYTTGTHHRALRCAQFRLMSPGRNLPGPLLVSVGFLGFSASTGASAPRRQICDRTGLVGRYLCIWGRRGVRGWPTTLLVGLFLHLEHFTYGLSYNDATIGARVGLTSSRRSCGPASR